MANNDAKSRDHLGRDGDSIYWDWSGENPVEIILVIFILVLFFMLPRTGCGIDKSQGQFPAGQSAEQVAPSE